MEWRIKKQTKNAFDNLTLPSIGYNDNFSK